MDAVLAEEKSRILGPACDLVEIVFRSATLSLVLAVLAQEVQSLRIHSFLRNKTNLKTLLNLYAIWQVYLHTLSGRASIDR